MSKHPITERRRNGATSAPDRRVCWLRRRLIAPSLHGLLLAAALLIAATGNVRAQAIAFVGVGTSTNTGGGAIFTLTINVPAGVALNDVMLAHISYRGGSGITITPPIGWIQVIRTDADASGDIGQIIYRRIATAVEPATYDFGLNPDTRAQGQILAYRNVSTVTPVDVSAGGFNNNSNSIVAPSVTTTVPNTLLVGFFAIARAGSTVTPPGSMTDRSSASTGAGPNGLTIDAADEAKAATGASGTRTASASNTTGNVGQLIALRPFGCTPAFFTVDPGAGTASTCVPRNFVITARDAGNAVLTCYTGTINLSTTTLRGDWSRITGAGTFTPIGSNVGTAQYQFSALDSGVATLALSNQSADDLRANVVDASAPATLSQSPVVQFRDNVFVITEDPIQVAGRPQAMSVAMWRRDTSGSCGIAAGYAGAKNLKGWVTRDVADPGGAGPTVGAATMPNAVPGANNVTLNFAAGSASFSLGSTDVGKYLLNLRDDSRAFASGVDINGSSATLTVRPFGLTITGVLSGVTANPGGTATTGARFTPAGELFSATVTARLWQGADDANNDGVPDAGSNLADNAATPNYRWATQLALTTPVTPVTGTAGTLAGTTAIAGASFAGGAASVADLSYSEVGSMTLSADATNFLGSAGVNPTGISGVIGRFYPDHFTLLLVPASSVTPACAAGGFSYMGHAALGASFSIEARNKSDGKTTKYNTASYTTGTIAVVAENANDGVDRSGRITSLPAVNWVDGTYALSTSTAVFSRPATPDGPFAALDLGVLASDPDGALITNRNMNAATTGDCVAAGNCDAVKIGSPTEVRFGRLYVTNVSGTARLDLPLNIETEYYTGVGFLRNAQDSCTSLTATAVGMANFTGNLGPLASCKTAIETPAGTVSFSGGIAQNAKLRKPGTANAGSVELTVKLDASSPAGSTCTAIGAGAASSGATAAANLGYLQGNWGGAAAYDQDPRGQATFGVYKNANEFIYFQENY